MATDHKCIFRGATKRAQGQLQLAIEDYTQAVVISWRIQNNRGITDAAGGLAQTLEQRKPTTRAAIRNCGSRSAHEQQTGAEIKWSHLWYPLSLAAASRPKPKKKPCTNFFHLCVEPLVTKCG
jgi:hypothetical protein